MVTGSAEFHPIAPLSPPPTNMKNDHQETCTYVCVWLAIADLPTGLFVGDAGNIYSVIAI